MILICRKTTGEEGATTVFGLLFVWSVRDSCMVRGKKWTPGPIVCLRNTDRPCEKWSAHTKACMVAKTRTGEDKKLNIDFMWPNSTPVHLKHVQDVRL